MEPKELFGVIVRTFGLSMTIYGLWYLVYGIAQAASLSEPTYPTGDFVISGAACTLMGAFLLLAAGVVVRFAYRNPPISN
jgi:hypothetical protein